MTPTSHLMTNDTVISDWTPEKAEKFGRETVQFRHGLHERPMFSDEALVDVLDRYPRERLGVFTMGHDLVDWTSWRRGDPGEMTGRQLMDAVNAGRIWLNLREANRNLPEYADLCEEISAEKERHIGAPLLKRDLGLLISSPRAMVFYHLDVPLSSLWHIRGDKKVFFYPRAEPFVSDAIIETFVTKEAEGQFAFQPEWDQAAHVIDMLPGDMVTWQQNLPHRVQNGATVNVSLSMEFMTPQALARANVLYANAKLRKRFGAQPRVQDTLGPRMLAKLAYARAMKAVEARRRVYRPILPVTFALDPAQPGVLHPV
ncbi:MAG TPA: hypothetical protein VG960_01555 [Caulobacteraceae bacterium]|nr:hypothetical protein [Caulobacteraceae bacterium]